MDETVGLLHRWSFTSARKLAISSKRLGGQDTRLYSTVLPCTSWQGTIGKRMIGAVIVDEEGERISYFRSVLRYLAQILSALILCIGYIMIGFSETKRGLHDWIASTFVISKNSRLYP
ncbi:RDD family protein [Paenibacillus puldeungensis]|uniref:RDD family protein n=1 Tax=Paenibacillus puldeungensis TaxID=696536 RepID=A0ABW3RSZ1_9BACL